MTSLWMYSSFTSDCQSFPTRHNYSVHPMRLYNSDLWCNGSWLLYTLGPFSPGSIDGEKECWTSESEVWWGATFSKQYEIAVHLLIIGQPMPPYNPVFGYLLFVGKITSKLQKDAHSQYLPDQIRRAMPELGSNYYIGAWPFGPPILVVSTLLTWHQITQEHSPPKCDALKKFLQPLTGGLHIVTMEGQIWKTWPRIYSPGFSLNTWWPWSPALSKRSACSVTYFKSTRRGRILSRWKAWPTTLLWTASVVSLCIHLLLPVPVYNC